MSPGQELIWTAPLAGAGALLLAASIGLIASIGGARLGGGVSLMVRVALCGAIAGALLGPSWKRAVERPAEGPLVEVLLDTSKSMCAPAGPGFAEDVRRIDALRRTWLRSEALGRAWEQGRLAIGTFEQDARIESWSRAARAEPDGASTRLAHAVRERLRAPPRGGAREIILLTDGVDTTDPSGGWSEALAGRALAVGARLWAVVPGDEQAPPDLAVEAALDRAVVALGESARLRVNVRQRGLDGLTATLTIRARRGAGAPWSIIARRALTLGPPARMDFPIEPPAEGLFEYEARIEPFAREAQSSNNRATAFLEATDAPIRVTLFENEPAWETTFFAQALREDPGVRLTSVYGLGAARSRIVSESEHPAIDDPEWLMRQDIIALGRGAQRWFDESRAPALRRFVVERGGSLLLLRGDPVDAGSGGGSLADVIAELAPVIFRRGGGEGGPLRLTWTGRTRSPAAGLAQWEALPDLASVEALRRAEEKGVAEVWLRLAGGGGETALAHARVGRGSVLVSLMEGTWRWAFSDNHVGLEAHRELWARTARWLALGGRFLPGQELRVRTGESDARTGRHVDVFVDARWFESGSASPRLTLTRPDGAREELPVTRPDPARAHWRASLVPQEDGIYELEARLPLAEGGDASAMTRIAVAQREEEMADLAARRELMRALCERTGGGLLPIDEPEAALRLIENVGAAQTEWRIEPAWDRWWIFALAAGALLSEWTWRRRRGLA